jgi:hypothetical protein
MGVIRFEYGRQSIKCAEGIGKAEALVIMQEMKEQRYLTERHFKSEGVVVN